MQDHFVLWIESRNASAFFFFVLFICFTFDVDLFLPFYLVVCRGLMLMRVKRMRRRRTESRMSDCDGADRLHFVDAVTLKGEVAWPSVASFFFLFDDLAGTLRNCLMPYGVRRIFDSKETPLYHNLRITMEDILTCWCVVHCAASVGSVGCSFLCALCLLFFFFMCVCVVALALLPV